MTGFTFYNLCDYFEYLDDLRKSGTANMFGAAPYLAAEYPDLGIQQARQVLKLWQDTFSAEPLEERVYTAQNLKAPA
jgi:hypothetical protein